MANGRLNWIIYNYSVLSLGDSSYEFFCHTGKQFDERLAELGAKRLTQRIDCDLDYDEPFEEWASKVLTELNEQLGANQAAVQQTAGNAADQQPSSYSRTKPFQAEILRKLKFEWPWFEQGNTPPGIVIGGIQSGL